MKVLMAENWNVFSEILLFSELLQIEARTTVGSLITHHGELHFELPSAISGTVKCSDGDD